MEFLPTQAVVPVTPKRFKAAFKEFSAQAISLTLCKTEKLFLDTTIIVEYFIY